MRSPSTKESMDFNVQKNTHSANVACINAYEVHVDQGKQKNSFGLNRGHKQTRTKQTIIYLRTSYDSVPPVE